VGRVLCLTSDSIARRPAPTRRVPFPLLVRVDSANIFLWAAFVRRLLSMLPAASPPCYLSWVRVRRLLLLGRALRGWTRTTWRWRGVTFSTRWRAGSNAYASPCLLLLPRLFSPFLHACLPFHHYRARHIRVSVVVRVLNGGAVRRGGLRLLSDGTRHAGMEGCSARLLYLSATPAGRHLTRTTAASHLLPALLPSITALPASLSSTLSMRRYSPPLARAARPCSAAISPNACHAAILYHHVPCWAGKIDGALHLVQRACLHLTLPLPACWWAGTALGGLEGFKACPYTIPCCGRRGDMAG